MKQMEKSPYVPTEFRVGTLKGKSGLLGILSIQTTEGRLDVALDLQAADAIVCAVNAVRTKLASNEASGG
jgi:hypothetical protein